jgi:hypothetical protein
MVLAPITMPVSYSSTTPLQEQIDTVEYDGVLYEVEAKTINAGEVDNTSPYWYVGNPQLIDERLEADERYPFCFYNAGMARWAPFNYYYHSDGTKNWAQPGGNANMESEHTWACYKT